MEKRAVHLHYQTVKSTDLKIQRVSMDKWIKQFVPVRF